MAIKHLTSVVAPPPVPVETGDKAKWQSIQKNLGTRLPDDFRDLGMTYGSGRFVDRDRLEVYVYQPFSRKFREWVDTHAANLAAFKVGEGDDYIPYDVFPDSPGLLVWGGDVNGNELYWYTKGKPNDWRIVVRSRSDDGFEEFDGPVTLFLAKAFTRNNSVKVWPDPFFLDPVNIVFEPDQAVQHEEMDPSAVYELYVQNGNRAGFWVRYLGSQKGVFYFVKSVDGKSEGPLEGIPVEYNRQRVQADVYLHGQLFEEINDLSNAYQRMFVRVNPPV